MCVRHFALASWIWPDHYLPYCFLVRMAFKERCLPYLVGKQHVVRLEHFNELELRASTWFLRFYWEITSGDMLPYVGLRRQCFNNISHQGVIMLCCCIHVAWKLLNSMISLTQYNTKGSPGWSQTTSYGMMLWPMNGLNFYCISFFWFWLHYTDFCD